MGSCAIQLAKGAGLDVATTASGHNRDYCLDLGAKYVFDHTKETVVEEIVKELGEKKFAGVFDAISTNATLSQCARIADSLQGNKHVATVLPPRVPLPSNIPEGIRLCNSKFLAFLA